MSEQHPTHDANHEMVPESLLENDPDLQDIREEFDQRYRRPEFAPSAPEDRGAARHEASRAAASDVYALFEDESAGEQAVYEPRSLGSASGDWDFVRAQRDQGHEVTVGSDLSVSITDADGITRRFGALDEAMSTLVSSETMEEAPESVSGTNLSQSEMSDDGTLSHVESLIVRHETKGDTPQNQEARALVSSMEQQGIVAQYEQFSPDSTEGQWYEGMFVMQHERQAGDDEPRVRLYRGVNQIDMGIFHQQSYAEKGLYSDWKGQRYSTPAEKQAATEKVHAFQANPSYDALWAYVDTLSQVGGQDVARRMKDRMRDIEDHIMATGDSVQKALAWEHVKSASGVDAGIDISPYMGVAETAEVGGAYARKGMIVYDVPLSMIAGRGEEGELLISGELTDEHVAAFAVCKVDPYMERQARDPASQAIGEHVALNEQTVTYAEVANHIDMLVVESDKAQATQDMQAIHNKRAHELLSRVGGAQLVEELGIAPDGDMNYQQTQAALYEYFSAKLERDGANEFVYHDGLRQQKMSRETITDAGIVAMRREYEDELDRRAVIQHKREHRRAVKERAAEAPVAVQEAKTTEPTDPRAALSGAIRQEWGKVNEYVAYAGYRDGGPVQLRGEVYDVRKSVDALADENPDDENLRSAQKALSHIKPGMDSRQLQRIFKDVDQLIVGSGT